MRRQAWGGILLASLAGCGAKAPPGAGGARSAGRTFPVEWERVKTEDVQYQLEAVGSLEPQEEVRVAARVGGVAERVYVEEGMDVTPDTVLAEIDRSRYDLLAARANAVLDKAEVDLEKAETFLKNRQALRRQDPGWVSEEELHALTSQVKAAQAVVAEARSAQALAEQDREYARVRSLVAGTINTKHVATGQHVSVGAPIATLVDHSRLKLRFKVSEGESVGLQALLNGSRALSFTVRPLPGRTFAARLVHVSPRADSDTRMVECVATVERPDPALKAGFFAMIKAVVDTRLRAVVVPDTAVLPTERGFLAFVAEPGKDGGWVARQRSVKVGLTVREGVLEVLEGLKPGERLITVGAAAVRDGARVAPPDAGR